MTPEVRARLGNLMRAVRGLPPPAQRQRVVPNGLLTLPAALLEQLAPHEPHLNTSDHGDVWCAFCDAEQPASFGTRLRANHKPECPWVIARAVLGDHLDT